MVRFTSWLCRVPVIKFKKGGSAQSGASAAPPPGGSPIARPPSCPAPSRQSAGAAPAAAMSTRATIPDIDLPARYRRQPISEEEINHINGGGDYTPSDKKPAPKMLGMIKIPQGVLVSGQRGRKELVTLNIVLQKQDTDMKKR